MPSTSGSTETGHSGNGYVRITKKDNISEVVLDYINIAGTTTEATITYGSALKGIILYKSPGLKFNYIEIRLNNMQGDDLVINKYNASSITLLH